MARKRRVRSAALLWGLAFCAGFLLGRATAPSVRVKPEPPRKIKAFPSPSLASVFPRGSGRIAIVLDDWGYNLRQVPALSAIRRPLTVAVLPDLPYSSRVAQAAHSQGHEVILHLPMEADDPGSPREAGTILTQMSTPEVLRRMDRSLASVPFARGISNHQGSKGTASRPLMETVLGELKRRDLYFLDSLVTGRSVGREVAKGLRMKFARRTVFLDNDPAPGRIQERLIELAKTASRAGRAIGIGHDRPNTLRILGEAVPALEKAGYTLVPVSELAEEAE